VKKIHGTQQQATADALGFFDFFEKPAQRSAGHASPSVVSAALSSGRAGSRRPFKLRPALAAADARPGVKAIF
jgi:hypothetical protein